MSSQTNFEEPQGGIEAGVYEEDDEEMLLRRKLLERRVPKQADEEVKASQSSHSAGRIIRLKRTSPDKPSGDRGKEEARMERHEDEKQKPPRIRYSPSAKHPSTSSPRHRRSDVDSRPQGRTHQREMSIRGGARHPHSPTYASTSPRGREELEHRNGRRETEATATGDPERGDRQRRRGEWDQGRGVVERKGQDGRNMGDGQKRHHDRRSPAEKSRAREEEAVGNGANPSTRTGRGSGLQEPQLKTNSPRNAEAHRRKRDEEEGMMKKKRSKFSSSEEEEDENMEKAETKSPHMLEPPLGAGEEGLEAMDTSDTTAATSAGGSRSAMLGGVSLEDDSTMLPYEHHSEESDEEGGMYPNGSQPISLATLHNKAFETLTPEERALLSPESLKVMEDDFQKRLIARLPIYYPGISGCRSVSEFECVTRIEEGAYGVVYRAVEKRTDEVVALKRLKMEKEKDGFPITSLREINMLLKCGSHKNIVNVREIVVGSNMDKIYLVMEYVEHDIKSLMEVMKNKKKKFTLPQVKTLMHQLLSGIEYMHEEYVIHRDLKTSNLLLSHNGVLKIADFGLAREYGDPLKPYTPVVVTLWYRSPELLLGVKEYSTAVDMWSVGCIFGELLQLKAMFCGQGEIDQLNQIFKDIGTPNESIWPGYNELPGVKRFAFANAPYNQLKKCPDKPSLTIQKKFVGELRASEHGAELLNRLLAPCPSRRHSASSALASPWFEEDPKPIPPELFPTYPAKSEQNQRPGIGSTAAGHPPPSAAASEPITKQTAERLKLLSELNVDAHLASSAGSGFALKFDAPKFAK